MKTKSNSRFGFVIPRVVLGFALCSAGVLLALAALNKASTTQSSMKRAFNTPKRELHPPTAARRVRGAKYRV